MKKSLLIIIILILALAGSFYIFKLSTKIEPVPDTIPKTADEKAINITYNSSPGFEKPTIFNHEQLPFTFSYPGEWAHKLGVYDDGGLKSSLSIRFQSPQAIKDEKLSATLQSGIPTNDLILSKFALDTNDDESESNDENDIHYLVDGVKMTQYFVSTTGGWDRVVFTYQGNLYQLDFPYIDHGTVRRTQQPDDTIKQILSTIKFK